MESREEELRQRAEAHDFVEKVRADYESRGLKSSEAFFVGLWHGYKAAIGELAEREKIAKEKSK